MARSQRKNKMTTKTEVGKIRTPIFRGSYSKIANPTTTENGKLKWEITAVFQIDGDNWKEDPKFGELINGAVLAATNKFGSTKGIYFPFRDNDSHTEDTLEKNPIYKGCLVLPLVAYGTRPDCAKLVNGKPVRLEDAQLEEMYSGAHFIATVKPFAYTTKKKGVSFGLSSLLKVKDDDHLSAYNDAMKDFEDFDASQYGVDNSELFGGKNPADLI